MLLLFNTSTFSLLLALERSKIGHICRANTGAIVRRTDEKVKCVVTQLTALDVKKELIQRFSVRRKRPAALSPLA
jgi:hypothetical protein